MLRGRAGRGGELSPPKGKARGERERLGGGGGLSGLPGLLLYAVNGFSSGSVAASVQQVWSCAKPS